MGQAAALSVLALTVGLSLSRPTIGHFRIQPAGAAILGALLTMAAGLLPLPAVLASLTFLALPVDPSDGSHRRRLLCAAIHLVGPVAQPDRGR